MSRSRHGECTQAPEAQPSTSGQQSQPTQQTHHAQVVYPPYPPYPPPHAFYGYPPPVGGMQHPPQAPLQQQGCQQCSGHNGHHCGGHKKRRCRSRKFFFFLGLIAVIWATASVTFHHGHKIVGFIKMRKLAKEMQVTPMQRDKLISIGFKAYHNNIKHRKEFKEMRREFFHLLSKEQLTQKEVDAFVTKHIAKIQKVLLSNTPLLLEARAVLTPEQRRILAFRIQQMQRHKRRWRRHWHPHPTHAPAHLPTPQP
ncbi:MAG TPA: hypothetical protein DCE42_11515 [Myxococcales bacterium]|nr:hypothetical protein [Deltaproteobacteria bacterium]HAA55378.1 hypothetical protein [Myxococcales bacterium]